MSAKVAKSSKRGSAPGERRGGRKKGTLNKSTADLKAIAGQYTEEAVEALVKVIRGTESDAARVSAVKELLDRAHGRATQSVDVSGDMTFKGLDVTIRR